MDPDPYLYLLAYLLFVFLGSLYSAVRHLFELFSEREDHFENSPLEAMAAKYSAMNGKEGREEFLDLGEFIVSMFAILSGTLAATKFIPGHSNWEVPASLLLVMSTVYILNRHLLPAFNQIRIHSTARPLFYFFSIQWVLFGWAGKALHYAESTLYKKTGFYKKYRIFTENDLIKKDMGGTGLDPREAEMLKNVIRIRSTVAKEIFTPRVDCVALDVGSNWSEITQVMKLHKYTRIPVFENTIDNIVGILNAKDLLFRDEKDGTDLRHLIRPAYFVPRSKNIEELMMEFKTNRIHMAIVVDEYGGTAGLITLEDILEEIVGEIQDEDDQEIPKIYKVNPRTYIIDPIVTLDEINNKLNLNIKPKEEVDIDTLGGYLQYMKGTVPQEGDRIAQNGYIFEILKMEGQSIEKVRMTLKKSDD